MSDSLFSPMERLYFQALCQLCQEIAARAATFGDWQYVHDDATRLERLTDYIGERRFRRRQSRLVTSLKEHSHE